MSPEDPLVVRPDIRLRLVLPLARDPSPGIRMGLRDRVRARFSREESEPSPSFSFVSSCIGSGCGDLVRARRATDRVKYPSPAVCSDDSDGVGEGDMTRGVVGIGYANDIVPAERVCTDGCGRCECTM